MPKNLRDTPTIRTAKLDEESNLEFYAEARLRNRKVRFLKEKDSEKILLIFRNTKDATSEKPAATSEVIRGRIRETTLAISEEGLFAIIALYERLIRERGIKQYKEKRDELRSTPPTGTREKLK